MKPFAFLLARPSSAKTIRVDEVASVKRFGQLTDDQFEVIDLELNPEIQLDRYAAVFLSGSQYGFLDDHSTMTAEQKITEKLALEVVAEVIERDFPFLGLCYGHQALAVASGVELTDEYFEKMSVVNIDVTEAGRKDPIFSQLPAQFPVVLGHAESIGQLPPNTEVLASSPLCPTQAVRVKNNVYGTQFHPEIDQGGLEVRIGYYGNSKYAQPDELDQIRASGVGKKFGGAQLIRAFTRKYRDGA